MKFDVILAWPNNIDYPLWRQFVEQNPHYFNKLLIHFNDTHLDLDLSSFVKAWFKSIKTVPIEFFSTSLVYKYDWRDQIVNLCLSASEGEFVWFTEQDFLIKDPADFFTKVSLRLNGGGLVSFKQNNRWHPACIFASRTDIEQTRKNFGAHPPESDHFGWFSEDMDELSPFNIDLNDIDLIENKDWFHHNGLSQNYHLAQQGKPPNYLITEFLVYNAASREAKVSQDRRYIELTHKVEKLLTNIGKFVH
jgi:hypothetical protein